MHKSMFSYFYQKKLLSSHFLFILNRICILFGWAVSEHSWPIHHTWRNVTARFLPFLCWSGVGRHDHISMITLDSHGLSLLYKQNYYQYPCSCSRSVLVWARNYVVTLSTGTGLVTKGGAYIEFQSFIIISSTSFKSSKDST